MKWPFVLHMLSIVVLVANVGCEKSDIDSNTLVIGHAGMALSPERAIYPPNSEKSIFYALDVLGADGVEVDVQMTADSVLVLFHDLVLNPTDFKNLNEENCISNMAWAEVESLKAEGNKTIIKLSEVLPGIIARGKWIQLDVRHYNQCEDAMIDFGQFNRALFREVESFSEIEKQRIIVNSRNINLLDALQDSAIIKSFESEEVELAIDYYEDGFIDLLTTRLEGFTREKAANLKGSGLVFYLYNVKSKKSIKTAAEFEPDGVITDNIAMTKSHFD